MEIVKTMAWRYLWTLLWTLLLIVPGIVKAFAYSMVPYILADNPEIGYRRALQLSQEMTRGHKWNILVLGFSFIGWYLLGAMLLMVGVFFVHPYFEATMAELYGALRKEALEKGLCSPEEFYLDQTDYVLDHQGPIEF